MGSKPSIRSYNIMGKTVLSFIGSKNTVFQENIQHKGRGMKAPITQCIILTPLQIGLTTPGAKIFQTFQNLKFPTYTFGEDVFYHFLDQKRPFSRRTSEPTADRVNNIWSHNILSCMYFRFLRRFLFLGHHSRQVGCQT